MTRTYSNVIFGDLSTLVIIGVVCVGTVSKQPFYKSVSSREDTLKQLEQGKKRTRDICLDLTRLMLKKR